MVHKELGGACQADIFGCGDGNATGMYTGDAYAMVITVLDGRNMHHFMSSMKAHPDTFIYFSDGVKVQGEYHFGKTRSERIDAY